MPHTALHLKPEPPCLIAHIMHAPFFFFFIFSVCGGDYGIEDTVGAAGARMTLMGLLILPWIWSLPIALMTAELGSMIPEAGGYVVWIHRAFGPFWAHQNAVWNLVANAFDNALYPVMFVDYLRYFPAFKHLVGFKRWLVSVSMLCCVTGLNLLGVDGARARTKPARGSRPAHSKQRVTTIRRRAILRASRLLSSGSLRAAVPCGVTCARDVSTPRVLSFPCSCPCCCLSSARAVVASASSIFAALVIAPFGALVVCGLPYLNVAALTHPFDRPIRWGTYLSVLLWNTSGYDSVGALAAEVHRPGRDFPRAMIATILLVTLVYVLPLCVAISMDRTNLARWSDGHFTMVAQENVGDWLSAWISIGGALSAVGLLNTLLCTAARVTVSSARLHVLPSCLAAMDERGLPRRATVAVALVLAFACALPFAELVSISMLFYGATTGFEFLALIVLRSSEPDTLRPFRIPVSRFWLPLAVLPPVLLCLLLICLAQREAWVIFVLSIGVGLGTYFLSHGCTSKAAEACWKPQRAAAAGFSLDEPADATNGGEGRAGRRAGGCGRRGMPAAGRARGPRLLFPEQSSSGYGKLRTCERAAVEAEQGMELVVGVYDGPEGAVSPGGEPSGGEPSPPDLGRAASSAAAAGTASVAVE